MILRPRMLGLLYLMSMVPPAMVTDAVAGGLDMGWVFGAAAGVPGAWAMTGIAGESRSPIQQRAAASRGEIVCMSFLLEPRAAREVLPGLACESMF